MNPDRWLQDWLPLLRERAGDAPVLELGCGPGDDTAVLAAAGLRVVALDLSPSAIDRARAAVPQAEFHVADLRDAFPALASPPGAVVASLSLHYFAWDDTVALVERVRTALRPGGVLLCRLNSTNDHHWGASGHPRIDDNYYLVDGEPKRFFDRASIARLFAGGWGILSLREQVIDRYALPKVVWEIILERIA